MFLKQLSCCSVYLIYLNELIKINFVKIKQSVYSFIIKVNFHRVKATKFFFNRFTKNINKLLLDLRFIERSANQALRKRLVESLVLPQDYFTVVLHNQVENRVHNASSTLRTRLQLLANARVRYIFRIRWELRITSNRK